MCVRFWELLTELRPRGLQGPDTAGGAAGLNGRLTTIQLQSISLEA